MVPPPPPPPPLISVSVLPSLCSLSLLLSSLSSCFPSSRPSFCSPSVSFPSVVLAASFFSKISSLSSSLCSGILQSRHVLFLLPEVLILVFFFYHPPPSHSRTLTREHSTLTISFCTLKRTCRKKKYPCSFDQSSACICIIHNHISTLCAAEKI